MLSISSSLPQDFWISPKTTKTTITKLTIAFLLDHTSESPDSHQQVHHTNTACQLRTWTWMTCIITRSPTRICVVLYRTLKIWMDPTGVVWCSCTGTSNRGKGNGTIIRNVVVQQVPSPIPIQKINSFVFDAFILG